MFKNRVHDARQRGAGRNGQSQLRRGGLRGGPILQNAPIKGRQRQNGVNIGKPAPGWRQVDVLALVRQRGAAARVPCEDQERVFSQRHEIVIVGIGLIKLQHRELRIMDRRKAFITKIAIQFKDPLEAADDQPLEIEFRRDAQIQIGVQRVMVRREGTGSRPTGDGVHHRRFDFKKSAVGQIRAKAGDHPAARLKDAVDAGGGHQVNVALPITDFDVRQPVPFFRKRSEPFRQKRQRLHLHGEFIGLRAEHGPVNADPIAEIQDLRKAKGVIAQRVLAKIHLKPMRPLLKRGERRFAESAQGNNASRDPARDPPVRQFILRRRAVSRHHPRNRLRPLEAGTIRRHAHAPQRLKFLKTVSPLIVQVIRHAPSPASCFSCFLLRHHHLPSSASDTPQ